MSVPRVHMTRSKTKELALNKENVSSLSNVQRSPRDENKMPKEPAKLKNKRVKKLKESEAPSTPDVNMVSSPFTDQKKERILGRGSLGQVFYSPSQTKSSVKRKKTEVRKRKGNMIKSKLITEKENQPTMDGNHFLEVVAEYVEKLESGAKRIEEMLSSCGNEEACGLLRATAGKARLLVAEKINQFIGLCHKNINQSPGEPFPTTDNDLAGFWDMVMIQVDQVLDQFEKVNLVKKNNWKIIAEEPKIKEQFKRTIKPKTAVSKPKEISALAKQRDTMRKIIAEKKLAMQKKTFNDDTLVVN